MTASLQQSPEQRHRKQLFKILDGIGSEAEIRCLLIGGTLTSHLQALSSAKTK